MAIDGSRNNQLHPTTFITFRGKKGNRVMTTVLIDQCCTGRGLISSKQAELLGLEKIPIPENESTTFKTAAGVFEADKQVTIESAMLPCLSTNRTFKAVLKVIPKECNSSQYGVIIGQIMMREIDLDTSVRDNTISWGDITTPMVPRNYWTETKIRHNYNRI